MHLVGFIIKIYHDTARSAERQILLVKSTVLNLFNLLSSSSSGSVDASSFGCVVVLALHLKLNFVILSPILQCSTHHVLLPS